MNGNGKIFDPMGIPVGIPRGNLVRIHMAGWRHWSGRSVFYGPLLALSYTIRIRVSYSTEPLQIWWRWHCMGNSMRMEIEISFLRQPWVTHYYTKAS